MVLKILLTVVLAIVGFAIAARLSGGARPRPRMTRRRDGNAVEQGLARPAKCARCGIYLPSDQVCRCNGDA